MTVTVYKSTDASAPVVTGQVGALTTLLDAILVNGYGSKAAQGWTIAYTATNQRAYRMPSGTNQFYLNVDDTTGGGAATYARVICYEVMTAYATGTNPFPTPSQMGGGFYVHKSGTADATARPWWAYGNGKFFYLFIGTDAASPAPTNSFPTMGTLMVGDFISYHPGDAYNTILIAANGATAGQTTINLSLQVTNSIASNTWNAATASGGHYICRAWHGMGASVAALKFANLAIIGVNTSAVVGFGCTKDVGGTAQNAGTIPFPNGADFSFYMDKVFLVEVGTTVLRGELPGLWTALTATLPWLQNSPITGTGAQSGKTFDALRHLTGGNGATMYLETSNTW